MTSSKTEERCECCELLISACGRAAEAKQLAELKAWRRRLIRRGWFPARYGGVCDKCPTPYGPGTLIHSNVGLGWIAECCAPPMPKVGA